MVGVDPLEDWEKCRLPLEKLGYDYAEKAGVPGHHIFGRGRDLTERTHLLHVVRYLGTSWTTGAIDFAATPNCAPNTSGRRNEQLRPRPRDELDITNSKGPIWNPLKRVSTERSSGAGLKHFTWPEPD
jgi:hypothetical protein